MCVFGTVRLALKRKLSFVFWATNSSPRSIHVLVLLFELLHTSTGPSKCCSLFCSAWNVDEPRRVSVRHKPCVIAQARERIKEIVIVWCGVSPASARALLWSIFVERGSLHSISDIIGGGGGECLKVRKCIRKLMASLTVWVLSKTCD